MQTKLRGYALSISQATGVTDPTTLARVEQTMRDTIFHSTLDWQDKETFDRGAREAYGIERINARGKSPLILPEDTETARLLGVKVLDVPMLARSAS
jgi:hypothetical protein